MPNALALIFFLFILLYSSIIHEYAHGWMADQLGDPTAKLSGRLTMNPIVHIDPIGTILVPLILFMISNGTFMFGWAKPVPFNPFGLKDPEKDAAKIAFAGPASNLAIAIFFGLLIRIFPVNNLTEFFSIIVFINLLLAVFNLVPIPPLDGSKVLFSFLPESARNFKIALERYGLVFLMLFLFFGFSLITPIIQFLYVLVTGNKIPL